MKPLTIAGLIALAGIFGYGIGAGMWAGGADKMLEEHERRLGVLEPLVFGISERLTRIEVKIDQVVNMANRERERDDRVLLSPGDER